MSYEEVAIHNAVELGAQITAGCIMCHYTNMDQTCISPTMDQHGSGTRNDKFWCKCHQCH